MPIGDALVQQTLSPGKETDVNHPVWQAQVDRQATLLPAVLRFVVLLFLHASACSQVISRSNPVVHLSWDPNQESDLAGYRLYYGFESRKYLQFFDVGNTNFASLTLPLPDTAYYLAVTAYDTDGLESSYSSELIYRAPGGLIPIVTIPMFGSTLEDTTFEIPLGTLPGNPIVDWLLTKSPSHGRVELVDGKLTYTPEADYAGHTDAFEVVTGLGLGPPIRQQWSIEILGENDPPVAFDLWVTTQPDTPVDILLTGNDPEGSNLTFQLLSQPEKGSLTGLPPNLVYTPQKKAPGADAFTYVVLDGTFTSSVATVQIDITGLEVEPYVRDAFLQLKEDESLAFDLPVALEPELSIRIVVPPFFGTLLGLPPKLTYVPSTNFFGSDSFTFEAEDEFGRIDVAVLVFEVLSLKDPPSALPQHLTVPFNQPTVVDLSALDPDEDPLQFEIVDPPKAGTLTGTPPKLIYHPKPSETRTDSFTFRVFDGTEYSPPAVVSLNLEGPPMPGPSIHASVSAQGQIVLRWNIIPGRSYRVLFRESFDDPVWTPLSPSLVSEADFLEYRVDVPSGPRVGFYAVQLQSP